MKKIVCEMCGSTEFAKEGDYMVCQSCGTKFTIEDARKMMVEVSGTVNVANSAQFDNLVTLAKSAFDGGNFATAEKYLDQALAMDGAHPDLWVNKALSILGQTNSDKPRFDEAMASYLNAWAFMKDEEKEQKRPDLINEVVNAAKVNIDFWTQQVERERPSDNVVTDLINLYHNDESLLKHALSTFGVGEDEIVKTLNDYHADFISAVSAMANRTWKSTVAYNYYRDDLSNYGSKWMDYMLESKQEWLPSPETLNTFRDEVLALCDLMEFAGKESINPNPETYKVLDALYSNVSFFLLKLKDAKSYDRQWMDSADGGSYWWIKKGAWKDAFKNDLASRAAAAETNSKKYQQIILDIAWEGKEEERDALIKEKADLEKELSKLKWYVDLHKNRAADANKHISFWEDVLRKAKTFDFKKRKEAKEWIEKNKANIAESELEMRKPEFKKKVERMKEVEARLSEIQKIINNGN